VVGIEFAATSGARDSLHRLCSTLLQFVECDAIELFLPRGDEWERYGCERNHETRPTRRGRRSEIPARKPEPAIPESKSDGQSVFARLRDYLTVENGPPGSLLWNGSWTVLSGATPSARIMRSFEHLFASNWKAALLFPLELGSHRRGLLALESSRRRGFSATRIRLVEATVRIVSLIFANRFVDGARRERIKELTCLHAIAQIRTRRDLTTDEQLERIVRTLPPACRFPELAGARIVSDGREFSTRALEPGSPSLSADIKVRGEKRGFVEIAYDVHAPLDDGPYLKEEASLLDTVAKELTLMFERKMAEDEEAKALAQLRHADRLATIGQLSAGVAHEINEPLASILGFTQLIRKELCLPEQALLDLQKIERAALQAREVVRNLLLFARQMPTPQGWIELNQVVREALSLLEPRMAGHEVKVELDPFLPPILGNSTHLHQVLVNLVTNAVQAMPRGGRLTVRTLLEGERVRLVVEDTGSGMTEELSERAFLPFFTTKEVGEGTGLGLSVAHGIVTSHGGCIEVQSEPGVGSRFTVSLPLPGRAVD
jgi:signal transduction histidine kinase